MRRSLLLCTWGPCHRAANVTSLGFDVNVFAASIGVDAKRPISLVLGSDMRTPDDPSDDCEVYFVGSKPVPRPGSSWRAFDFRIWDLGIDNVRIATRPGS